MSQYEGKVFFVLGGPGVGKGTQCVKLVEKHGFAHFSAGDLLRAEAASGSARGAEVKKMMEEGAIVPSEITCELLNKAMAASAAARGYVIDGFPRNMTQAKIFEDTVCKPTKVLNYVVSDAVATERILARGKSSGRVDDNEASLQKRFATHKETCAPVIEHYIERSLCVTIDAEPKPDDVFKATLAAVGIADAAADEKAAAEAKAKAAAATATADDAKPAAE